MTDPKFPKEWVDVLCKFWIFSEDQTYFVPDREPAAQLILTALASVGALRSVDDVPMLEDRRKVTADKTPSSNQFWNTAAGAWWEERRIEKDEPNERMKDAAKMHETLRMDSAHHADAAQLHSAGTGVGFLSLPSVEPPSEPPQQGVVEREQAWRDGVRQIFNQIANERIVRAQGAIPSATIRAESEAQYFNFISHLPPGSRPSPPAGKAPDVEELAKWFQRQDIRLTRERGEGPLLQEHVASATALLAFLKERK